MKKYLDDISLNLKRNKFLLGNLLNWSYTELEENRNLPQEIVDVQRILQELIEFLQTAANKKSILLKAENLTNTNVLANENALRVVFGNIISNAIKFTNLSGVITIRISKASDYAVVSISDNGIGISPERLRLILSVIRNTDHGINWHLSQERTKNWEPALV